MLGDGAEVDGEAPQKLVGFDAVTGAQVSSVDIDGAVTPITNLITPEVME